MDVIFKFSNMATLTVNYLYRSCHNNDTKKNNANTTNNNCSGNSNSQSTATTTITTKKEQQKKQNFSLLYCMEIFVIPTVLTVIVEPDILH